MPFVHFRNDDDLTNSRPKFRNPRKRASKLFSELTRECIEKSIASKPQVWGVPFRVGDAVELEILEDGGVDNPNNKSIDLVRGVVVGRENKGLDTSIYLKDVLYGEHVERKIKLHSPTVKSLKVLEAGFVNRGKKKGRRVKRAKLYYLRDRGMEGEYKLLCLLVCRGFVVIVFISTTPPHYFFPFRVFEYTHSSCITVFSS